MVPQRERQRSANVVTIMGSQISVHVVRCIVT